MTGSHGAALMLTHALARKQLTPKRCPLTFLVMPAHQVGVIVAYYPQASMSRINNAQRLFDGRTLQLILKWSKIGKSDICVNMCMSDCCMDVTLHMLPES